MSSRFETTFGTNRKHQARARGMTARLEDGTPNDPMVDLLEDWPLVCTHKGTHLYTPLPSSGSGRQKNFKQDKRHKFAEEISDQARLFVFRTYFVAADLHPLILLRFGQRAPRAANTNVMILVELSTAGLDACLVETLRLRLLGLGGMVLEPDSRALLPSEGKMGGAKCQRSTAG